VSPRSLKMRWISRVITNNFDWPEGHFSYLHSCKILGVSTYYLQFAYRWITNHMLAIILTHLGDCTRTQTVMSLAHWRRSSRKTMQNRDKVTSYRFVSDIAVFVLKRGVKLQLTN